MSKIITSDVITSDVITSDVITSDIIKNKPPPNEPLQTKQNIKNEEIIKIPKKRGRKKKIKTEEELERERNKPKQRRGRKPKSEIKNINKSDINELLKKNENIKETVILNLKIDNNTNNKNNLNNNYMTCNAIVNEPKAYDEYNLNNNYTLLPDLINKDIVNSNDISNNDKDIINSNDISNNHKDIINSNDISNNNSDNNSDNNITFNNNSDNINTLNNKKYIYNNLEEFILNKKWNKKTNVCCFWCCHSFTNIPFGIPIKYKDEKFHVYGCFCSLECAAAYNFSEEKIIQDSWECYNLIIFLSNKINYKNIVKLAPNRTCLKIFGGQMDIDEFRNFRDLDKIINVLEYPMIAVTQQIEEINYNSYDNNNNYIAIDTERIKKLEQKIQLKRTKPLLNKKNTLEHTMNIKINK